MFANSEWGGIPAEGLTVTNLLDPTKRNNLLASAELRRYKLDLDTPGHVDYSTFPVTDVDGRNSTVFELPTVSPHSGQRVLFRVLMGATLWPHDSETLH